MLFARFTRECGAQALRFGAIDGAVLCKRNAIIRAGALAANEAATHIFDDTLNRPFMGMPITAGTGPHQQERIARLKAERDQWRIEYERAATERDRLLVELCERLAGPKLSNAKRGIRTNP